MIPLLVRLLTSPFGLLGHLGTVLASRDLNHLAVVLSRTVLDTKLLQQFLSFLHRDLWGMEAFTQVVVLVVLHVRRVI